MDTSVDLPAPFSPTTPWVVPSSTERLTSRLAWTAPKRLSMWRSSIAGAIVRRPSSGTRPSRPAGMTPLLNRAFPVGHVVVHLDLARLDVGRRGLDGGAH